MASYLPKQPMGQLLERQTHTQPKLSRCEKSHCEKSEGAQAEAYATETNRQESAPQL